MERKTVMMKVVTSWSKPCSFVVGLLFVTCVNIRGGIPVTTLQPTFYGLRTLTFLFRTLYIFQCDNFNNCSLMETIVRYIYSAT